MAIVVVDYGMGNLRSVHQALVHVADGREVLVSADPAQVAKAERVVFPGQGAMPDCMAELKARGLRDALLEAAKTKPFLGICIGLQMLFEHSEEGDAAGLGVFAGQVRRLITQPRTQPRPTDLSTGLPAKSEQKLKVPHMGWNRLEQTQTHALWAGIADGARFYFVHSYHVQPLDQSLIVGTTNYGAPFTSAVAQDNIFALQCHPEKSAAIGLSFLRNFIHWQP